MSTAPAGSEAHFGWGVNRRQIYLANLAQAQPLKILSLLKAGVLTEGKYILPFWPNPNSAQAGAYRAY